MTLDSIQTKMVPRAGQPLDWFRASDFPEDRVFDGSITALHFRDGFGIHTLNARACRSFESETVRNPGAVLHCFLEGSTSASLAGKPMNLGRLEGQPVQMVLTSLQEAETFWRRSDPNEYVRKVNVLMSHEWLDDNGLGFYGDTAKQSDENCRYEWTASGEEVRAMEALAGHENFTNPVVRMQAESLALGLVAGCFSKLNSAPGHAAPTPREMVQLLRMEDFVRSSEKLPTLAELSNAGGMSQSAMRRVFKLAHGKSALGYARETRLGLARTALEDHKVTVAQAAHIAGYGSPENFATAFRREHGISPSKARKI